jgi:hypothetical protein
MHVGLHEHAVHVRVCVRVCAWRRQSIMLMCVCVRVRVRVCARGGVLMRARVLS